MKPADGTMSLAELKEFASFDAGAQRYIRRALDVAFFRADAVAVWARDPIEVAGIQAQQRVYRMLPDLRSMIPNDSGLDLLEPFIGKLIRVSAFDLSQQRLNSFGAYRFLYERLIGATARPWLPTAYCAAGSLPHLHPEKRRQLLQAISEAAATAPGWSPREPTFYPEWIEKIEG